MAEHTSFSSHLELLFSKDTLTETDILDFPTFDITSADSPTSQSFNQTLLEGTITPRNHPNTFLTVISKRRKQLQPGKQLAGEKRTN